MTVKDNLIAAKAPKVWKPDGSTLILLDKKFPDTEGGRMSVCGHIHFGPFPTIGAEVLIEGKEGGEHYFRFTEVKPCNDPREMYFGSIKRYRVTYQGEVLWQEPAPARPPVGFFARISALFSRAVQDEVAK